MCVRGVVSCSTPDGDVDGDIANGDVDGILMRGWSWSGGRGRRRGGCWNWRGGGNRSWSGDRRMVMYASIAMTLRHWAMRSMTHRCHMMTLWGMASAIGVRGVSRRGDERS